jgi:hypothetical protein
MYVCIVYIESRSPISVLQAEVGARIGECQMPTAGAQVWRLGLDEQVSAFCVATGGGNGCVVALHSASRARCFALGVTRTVSMCTYVCVLCVWGGGGRGGGALYSASRARCFALGVTRTVYVCVCVYGYVYTHTRARAHTHTRIITYMHIYAHMFRYRHG